MAWNAVCNQLADVRLWQECFFFIDLKWTWYARGPMTAAPDLPYGETPAEAHRFLFHSNIGNGNFSCPFSSFINSPKSCFNFLCLRKHNCPKDRRTRKKRNVHFILVWNKGFYLPTGSRRRFSCVFFLFFSPTAAKNKAGQIVNPPSGLKDTETKHTFRAIMSVVGISESSLATFWERNKTSIKQIFYRQLQK